MLQYLLRWKTYRTLKSGLLIDYFVKRLFYYVSRQFTSTFTVFFGDKYVLEHFFSNLFVFVSAFAVKLNNVSKNTFLTVFRTTFIILSYILLIFFIIFVM